MTLIQSDKLFMVNDQQLFTVYSITTFLVKIVNNAPRKLRVYCINVSLDLGPSTVKYLNSGLSI